MYFMGFALFVLEALLSIWVFQVGIYSIHIYLKTFLRQVKLMGFVLQTFVFVVCRKCTGSSAGKAVRRR
jgi:hypothetical protein